MFQIWAEAVLFSVFSFSGIIPRIAVEKVIIKFIEVLLGNEKVELYFRSVNSLSLSV